MKRLLASSVLLTSCFYNDYDKDFPNYVSRQISKANYCIQNTECAAVVGKCPVGCHAFVNNNETDRIEKLIKEMKTSCVYECQQLDSVICRSNKCEGIYRR